MPKPENLARIKTLTAQGLTVADMLEISEALLKISLFAVKDIEDRQKFFLFAVKRFTILLSEEFNNLAVAFKMRDIMKN